VIELKQAKNQFAWIAPIVAFLLLVGVAWFLVWYWQGGASAANNLDPETRKALANGQIQPGVRQRPVIPGQPRNGTAAQQQFIPSLQILGKGVIVPRVVNNTLGWVANSGPYQVQIKPVGADYQFTLAVKQESAFTGADLDFMQFITQLAMNPIIEQQTHVSQDVIQKILASSDNGAQLIWPTLTISASDLPAIKNLWLQYVKLNTAHDAAHQAVGGKLLDAVAAAGKNALPANKDSLAKRVALAHQFVPPDLEAQFRDAIRQSTAPRPLTTITQPAAPTALPTAAPTPIPTATATVSAATRPTTAP
jgi:hypothetical protein